jgi:FkbM family methyltransferase
MLGRMRALGNTLTHLVTHPVGRRRPVGAIADWLRWQLGARLVPGPVVVPFVGRTVLVVEPGMTGATGNVYSGLHEFADMAFVLHFLRPEDTFGDVGANIGSYAVLAGGVCGASGVAVEPIAETAARLRRNLVVNGLAERVAVETRCVGREVGTVRMTQDRDTTNRITTASGGRTVEVPMTTLDDLFSNRTPTLLKVDVEGFEADVLAGGRATLSDPALQAVILEVTGDDAHRRAMRDAFRDAGFEAVRYDPEGRELEPTAGAERDNANTIFVRDLAAARARVKSAEPFSVKGLSW